MIIFAYLVIYIICSFFITFIFSCVCGLGDSLKDRRKKDRRKGIRPNCPDRRISNNFHASSIDEIDDVPAIYNRV